MRTWMMAIALLATPSAAQEINGVGALPQQASACLPTLQDQATGSCLGASSVPTAGMLYPLGPDFFFDGSNTLRLTGSLDTLGDVFCDELFAGGNQLLPGGLGLGTTVLGADLHIRRLGDVEVLLQADADGNATMDQPRITFSDFGGLNQAFIGFQDGADDLALRHLVSGGGINFDVSTFTTDSWEFRRRASTATDVEARITFNGNLQLDGSVSSPAADLAEFYPVAGPVEPGDVVAFSGDGLTLQRAHAGAPGSPAGVISSRPAFVMGLSYTRADERGVPPVEYAAEAREAHGAATASAPLAGTADELAEAPVDAQVRHEIAVNRRAPLALSGRVPCKVSAENGPIEPGDLLTVSSLPGHAVKATAAGAVIGTALEGWSAGQGTILVLANRGWFAPTDDLERRVRELERLVAELERR